MTHTFEIKDNFYLDGKPFQIISGGIHCFQFRNTGRIVWKN